MAWFSGGRKSRPLATRLAVARTGVPALSGPGPSGAPRAWAGVLTDLPATVSMSLASEQEVVRREHVRRTYNAATISAIPSSLLMCAGTRFKLANLAFTGEHVYAAPPTFGDTYHMICLWGTWLRIVPCGAPPQPGEFNSHTDIDYYRPTAAFASGALARRR